ncbi:MAG: DUF4381 domain-containing protein [Gammaproteobacteria bacterium]|nr:DUF4381 domain-containing protein [Gammaproteobacteria bacterium]
MDAGMGSLRDIHGLDMITWWPPAPGWWMIVLGVALLVVMVLTWRRWYWRLKVVMSWKADALQQLHLIRGRLRHEDARILAGEFSELLRRIAMASHGRRDCAGLAGEAWLAWLEEQDPNGFKWSERGRILIELPFSPPRRRAPVVAFEPLLQAAEEWVQRYKRRTDRSGLGGIVDRFRLPPVRVTDV